MSTAEIFSIDRDLADAEKHAWVGFVPGDWQTQINTRDFIQKNYTPYEGDDKFLAGPTARTKGIWNKVLKLYDEERKNGVLSVVSNVGSAVAAYGPGYIDKKNEKIVGVQTDAPLRRGIFPRGGIRVVEASLKSYGYEPDPALDEFFHTYRKDQNQGIFDAYTPEIRKARHSGVVTGLPDAYGRGRIIGDYRRVALYGIDRLIEDKKAQQVSLEVDVMDEDVIRLREELTDQVRALEDLQTMAQSYGKDISKPAVTAQEAIQATYFGYLGAIKDQNGAAMSVGRISTFLDIYIERDMAAGKLTEEEAQELIDDVVIKMRIARFLRTPDYNNLFTGDPIWATECIGGTGEDGRTLVTKSSYRWLQTLHNLGPAPEPNLTIMWTRDLPQAFKDFCAKTSIETSSIQYENDEIMRPMWGDDYGIACCVSAMRLGKQMQFFGARVNLAKALLYAINGGKDELTGEQVGPAMAPITADVLDYDEVMAKYDPFLDWLAKVYVQALNIIHYMHDKYNYEQLEMALHDRDVYRTMACGIAGLSVVADSMSAIKYAKVSVIRDKDGMAVDYKIEGDFPKFGNNDDRVDSMAVALVKDFMNKVRANPTYRNSVHTQSVLTITSNVVYGKKTGSTPDGRKKGEAFAPGANPMHGRDSKGAIASAASVAKLPYEDAQDGISYTFSIIPKALGRTEQDQIKNLLVILDAYTEYRGHHINVNVFDREQLIDAMDHPEKYPQLTVRVSGYAVNFIKLTREQQEEVIARTFHESLTAQEQGPVSHEADIGRIDTGGARDATGGRIPDAAE
ncbi:MAG: formate C-acetyltransferase [Alphaproteobacteria bacterium]|nr:formate C-acetyltransferase [Alphaproteobacteria bacterium]